MFKKNFIHIPSFLRVVVSALFTRLAQFVLNIVSMSIMYVCICEELTDDDDDDENVKFTELKKAIISKQKTKCSNTLATETVR